MDLLSSGKAAPKLSFMVKLPTGMYAKFSQVAHNFTRGPLNWEDAFAVCAKDYKNAPQALHEMEDASEERYERFLTACKSIYAYHSMSGIRDISEEFGLDVTRVNDLLAEVLKSLDSECAAQLTEMDYDSLSAIKAN